MPLFYFDITDGSREQDLAGSEFASLDQARTQAIEFAGELLKDHSHLIWDGHDLRVEVLDERRVPLFTVVIAAITMVPADGPREPAATAPSDPSLPKGPEATA